MQRLILDFLSRWRWALAAALAGTVATTAWGMTLTLASWAVLRMMADLGSGVMRVVIPLPLSSRKQAHAWWLFAVVVLPLLFLPALALGTVLHQVLAHPDPVPSPFDDGVGIKEYILGTLGTASWPVAVFSAALQAWVGFGCSALLFLYVTLQPMRPPNNLREKIGWMVKLSVIAAIILGVIFLPLFLPHRPANVGPWTWAVFAIAPPLLVFSSFLASPRMLRRRMEAPVDISRGRLPEEPGGNIAGSSGVRLFFTSVSGPLFLLFLVLTLSEICLRKWRGGVGEFTANSDDALMLRIPIAMAALVSGAMACKKLCLRTLRSLPLSTKKLAALIFATPVAASLLGAAIISSNWLDGQANGGMETFVVEFFYLSGIGTLTLALVLRMPTTVGMAVYLLVAWIAAFAGVTLVVKLPILSGFGGALALALAVFCTLRGLRRSSALYRPRKEYSQAFAPR
jgi:hypothetical protein